MPRGRKLWYSKRNPSVYNAAPRQQCCVVCYSTFQPYRVSQSRWESSMTKVFYKAMNIPPFQTGGDEDGDEDDVLLSLPYCPECHSKISVMFNLYTQLEMLQNQYACVRNEIAFIVVETIGRNSSRGPMDFIRQQIFEKWREFYEEETAKGDYHDVLGLDALIAGNPFDLKDMFSDSVDEEQGVKEQQRESPRKGRQRSEEDFHSVSNIMELEYKENFIESDNEMVASDGETLAPNAVHMMADGEAENEMGGHFLSNSGTFHPQVEVKRKRGRPRGSTNGGQLPRLIPMKGRMRGYKHGRPGRDSRIDRKFGGHHFLAGTVNDGESLSHELEPTAGDESVNNQSEAYGDASQTVAGVTPKSADSSQDADDSLEVKPALRYPKRNVSGRALRSQQIKQEVDESYEEINDSMTDNSFGDGLPTEHYPPNTPGIFPCRLCPKFYTNSGRLLRHESLCHPSLKSIHCETCGKGFSSRLTYRRHRAHAHPDATEGTVRCPICQKTFLRKYSLEIHMKTHRLRGRGGRKPRAVVPEVNNSLLRLENGEASNSSTASAPQKNMSSPEKSRSELLPNASAVGDGLTCGICKKSFPYKTLLNVHFLTHAKKNFKCETCSAVFNSFSEMKAHADEAHRNKALKCSVCDQAFTAVEHLQRHKKIHDLKQEVPDPVEMESPAEQKEENLEETTAPAASSHE